MPMLELAAGREDERILGVDILCRRRELRRNELAEAAYAQMKELPYYNSFFRCSTPTPANRSNRLSSWGRPATSARRVWR